MGELKFMFKELIMNVATSKPSGSFNEAFPLVWKYQATNKHTGVPGKYTGELSGLNNFSRFFGIHKEKSQDSSSSEGSI